MLRSIELKNFTVFPEANLNFASGLNVIVGENGAGKTHLLKLPYAFMAMSAEEGRKRNDPPTKIILQRRIAEKIFNVFRPEDRIGRLARRYKDRTRCEVDLKFGDPRTSVRFNFASQNTSEVVVGRVPLRWRARAPVFLPTRELMTIYPGFVPLYESHHVEFDETLRDTCLLLGAPTLKGPRGAETAALIEPLEEQFGGRVILEKNGRFYTPLIWGCQHGNASSCRGLAQARYAGAADCHWLIAQ